MKLKRTIAAVAAAVTAFTMGAATLSACGEKCDHDFKWTTRTPATCVQTGIEDGVCQLCGRTEERTIPLSDEHAYGDWQITPPTTSQTGKAVKVCSLSAEHDLTVTLPVLTEAGTGYDSAELVSASTVTVPGKKTFVLKHEQGDITFTGSMDLKPFDGSVSDAVELGVYNKDLIRSASGRLNTDTKRYGYYNFMYEYGENYTHFQSLGGIGGSSELELWCSLDDNGEIYAVRTDVGGTPAQDTGAVKDYMDGYPFTISYAFDSGYYYGASQLLEGLYKWGLENPNKDFHEEAKQNEYTFGFSTYHSMYLSDISVSFTLTESGALDTLNVITNNYGVSSWELDEETEIGTITASAPDGIEVIEIQTVLKTEGDTVPQNPYPRSAFMIKSFDVKYGTKLITDETTVEVDADSRVFFSIENILDNSAGVNDLAYDPLVFYLRTDSGDTPIASDLVNNDDKLYVLQSNNQISFRSFLTGNLTIVIKTRSGSLTKLLNVKVNKIAPALGQLETFVYEYGDRAYVWNGTGETTIYAGQQLLFKADVASALQSYVDATVQLPTVRTPLPEGVAATDVSITESDVSQQFIFTAQKAGKYTIRLVSAANSNRYCNLIVDVLAVPDITEMLTGEYTAAIQYPQRGTVKVTFAPESATAGKVTVEVANLGTQTLSYVWNGESLTTEHVNGREDFGFELSINEAYKLVLSHPTGVGDGTEQVVINK